MINYTVAVKRLQAGIYVVAIGIISYICVMSMLDFTREQLAQYILNTAKESSISKIKSIILDEYKENDIVAYTVQGEPLTKEMYIKKVKDAEASVKAGNYTTVEDLEKEAENW